MSELQSYGDAQVDLYIAEIFDKTFKHGNLFFVDVGANDGITGSNTYLLEQQGWQGLLVEPNPEHLEVLKEKRLAPLEQCAISNQPSVTFNSVRGPGNLHGLSRIESNTTFKDHVRKHGGRIETFEVPAKTLTQIFKDNNVPRDLGLLSVDVEGHELTVFKTMDFKTYHPWLIVTEDNSKGRDREVHNFLVSQGYTLVKRVGVNEFYVPLEYTDKFFLSKLKTAIKYKRWQSKYFLKKLFGIKDNNPLV